MNKLPEVLTNAQKENKIHNLLRKLAGKGILTNSGSRRVPRWTINQ
jgi:hypothetical protein